MQRSSVCVQKVPQLNVCLSYEEADEILISLKYEIFEQALQMFQQQIAKRLLTINNCCNLGKRSALSLCGPRFKKGRPFYVYIAFLFS